MLMIYSIEVLKKISFDHCSEVRSAVELDIWPLS